MMTIAVKEEIENFLNPACKLLTWKFNDWNLLQKLDANLLEKIRNDERETFCQFSVKNYDSEVNN